MPDTVPALTTILWFTVLGKAAGKARPRVTRGGLHTYTPDPGGFVERVTEEGVAARQRRGAVISSGSIGLEVIVTRGMPKSWSLKKHERFDEQPAMSTPDLVNVMAAVCDALEGVFYKNDKQITDISGAHSWGWEHEVQIYVTQFGQGDTDG